jgi:hypothetical protein
LAKFSVIFSQNGDMRKEYCSTEAGYVTGITPDCAADIVLFGAIPAVGSTLMRAYDARLPSCKAHARVSRLRAFDQTK